jgi:hypothetical protein
MNLQEPEIELGPMDVANVLKIAYSKAKKLMETNEIRSWVDTNTSDGRRYWKTVYREVNAYHQRMLDIRESRIKSPKLKLMKTDNNKKANLQNGLSNKSIDEFFKTELYAS